VKCVCICDIIDLKVGQYNGIARVTMTPRGIRHTRRQLLLTGTVIVVICCGLQVLNALTFTKYIVADKGQYYIL